MVQVLCPLQNMSDLAKKVVPCKGNIPSFDLEEIQIFKKVNGWNVKSDNNKLFYLKILV